LGAVWRKKKTAAVKRKKQDFGRIAIVIGGPQALVLLVAAG
jgi:hypothetical protein